MKWRKENKSLVLGQCDLRIMAQCGITADEILKREHPNKNIPPLWSVLSYVMLQCNSDTDHLWHRYRTLLQMAADTDLWYDTRCIPKAAGGVRRISVPSHRICRQQEFILEHILAELPVSDHACAYRKGFSVADCAKPHTNRDVLLHLDIHDFFGSITGDMVFAALCRETGYPKSLCRFLAQLCCHRSSLPQGTVTSPMLSNIVFRPCDEALACISDKYGMNYTRYSDDLFFSADEPVNVGEALREVTQVLRSHGFRIHEGKTKVLRRQRRQEVLGLTVNEHIQVTRAYRRKLVQELYYLEKLGENCAGAIACGDYLKYMQQLQGKLAYVLHTDPDNEKLRQFQQKLLLRINRQIRIQEQGLSVC